MNNTITISLDNLQLIINYQKKVYTVLNGINFEDQAIHQKKILYITSGLGISNSLYEKFSKALMQIYCNIINSTIDHYIRFKAVGKIKDLISNLNLNLEYQFNLKKNEFNFQIPIQNYNELIERFSNSYLKRNYYLHGDFDLNENIDKNTFKEYVLEIMELQIFITELLKNALIYELPNYFLYEETQ